ncbi:MAG: hypothetical protein WCJ89_08770 [Actinomycetes bacterium]
MALSIGDKVIANEDNPGSNSKTKKGMIVSINQMVFGPNYRFDGGH